MSRILTLPMGLKHTTLLTMGESYWKVRLNSGKEYSEHDLSFDIRMGQQRSVDWSADIVGSGDNAKVAELTLCTKIGNATLHIGTPYTAFQLKRGVSAMFGDYRILEAQIIGRVDDLETGDCTAVIWDVIEQKLYPDFKTNVNNFGVWREGITRIGALSLPVVGVRLH